MQHSLSRLASSLKFTALAAFASAVGLASGCSGDDQCAGIEIDGQCYAECKDDQCVEGNRCVPDVTTKVPSCVPPCGIQDDCDVGTNCVDVNFPDGRARYCVAMLGGKSGQDEACASDKDCDTRRGWQCLPSGDGKRCLHTCEAHSTCQEGELCTTGFANEDGEAVGACQPGPCTSNANCNIQPGYHCIDSECIQAECVEHSNCEGGICKTGGKDIEGETTNYCTAAPDEKRGPGEFGTACPNGTDDCAEDFRCFGRGEGDVYSYCTQFDCTQDADCATGFHCGRVRVGDAPCDDTCSGIPAASAGATCVAASDIGAGKKYECGALNLMRNICVKNEYCAACETDEDCLGEPNQICAKGPDGTKQCTVTCDPTADSCPWGAASECKIFDTDRNVPTCGHKFGACKGDGKGCEPCVDDGDCGPQGICLSSSFTGEKYCLDLSLDCSCEGFPESSVIPKSCLGGTCPKTPGGLEMFCIGFLDDPTNPVNNKCYGANSNTTFGSSPQLGCYPN
ncbi:MAG: hypothetical protein KC766_18820 [Myxococcales bacterium]|nr:hypothetical protein [Myxococcales bacterium]